VKAVLAGAGARRALVPGARGTVLASMANATYLYLPGGIVAVVGPGVHPGPLHLGVDRPLPPVARGRPVSVTDRLCVGAATIDLGGAVPWDGALPDAGALGAVGAGALTPLRAAAARSALHALGPRAAAGLGHLATGDLPNAAACLAGLGPGMTPAGDDALAGAAFGLRALLGPPAAGPLGDLVAGLPTTAVSLAFLSWAARGQAIAPVHDLVAALAGGAQSAVAAACGVLSTVGASSGADFALGLSLAFGGAARRNAWMAAE
jgi:hypothetical protein